jgi:glutamine amidotransferase
MCELFCLSSRWPTRATFSLKAFAARGGVGSASIDGWGIAFHDGRDVRLYREPEPAGDSAWLAFIQAQRVTCNLIISHIRHATRGALTLGNTQPFARELAGRMHVFAHNGRLEGVEKLFAVDRSPFHPVGETDSELSFCLLLQAMADIWRDGAAPSIEARVAVVGKFAAAMRALGPANFLYSDGELVFAHGHRRTQADGTIAPPGLWGLQRGCAVDADALAPAGISLSPAHAGQEITLLASVPLSQEAWRPLAEGEIVVLAAGQAVAIG